MSTILKTAGYTCATGALILAGWYFYPLFAWAYDWPDPPVSQRFYDSFLPLTVLGIAGFFVVLSCASKSPLQERKDVLTTTFRGKPLRLHLVSYSENSGRGEVVKCDDSESLSSPSQETRPDRGVAMTVREADIITGAMAIARSRGHDPDSEAPLTEMCTDDNCPVPWWMVFTEEAEACLTAVALAAVKNTDYEHEKLYVYDATSQTFDHSTSSVTLDEVRTVLKQHYLTAIHCDHKDSTDRAGCWCSTWYCEPQPNIGAAVDRWIDHVMEQIESPGSSHHQVSEE